MVVWMLLVADLDFIAGKKRLTLRFSASITYSKMESLQNGCLDAVGCRFGLYRKEKEADRGAQPLLQARINRLCELVCAAMKA